MTTSNTTASIRESFSVFERASASLDLAVPGGLFAEQSLSLSPTSCQLLERGQFLAALPARGVDPLDNHPGNPQGPAPSEDGQ
jgi:hypothetical protein